MGALEEWGMERGVPSHVERVWGGGKALCPENFQIF